MMTKWKSLLPALVFALASACVLASGVQATPPGGPCTQAFSGLVAWWPFEDSSNDIYDVNDGGLFGDAEYDFGMVDRAVRLDGVDDHVHIPCGGVSRLNLQSFTIEGWVLVNGANAGGETGYQTIIGKSASDVDRNYALFVASSDVPGVNPGALVFACSQGGARHSWVGTIGVADGLWHHVAVTYDGLNTRLFVDGQFDIDAGPVMDPPPFGALDENGASVTIGFNTFASPNRLNGRIDELSIYDLALTGSDLQAVVSAGPAGKCDCVETVGMASLWPGDGDTYEVVHSNNGNPINGLSYAPGKVGPSFSFDGIDDGITVVSPSSIDFGTGQSFSIEGWIRADSDAADIVVIMDKRSDFVAGDPNLAVVGYVLYLNFGQLAFQLADAPAAVGTWSNFVSTSPDLRDGQFHHIAVSIERGASPSGTFYVDAQAVSGFDPSSEPGDLSNSGPLRIGHSAGQGSTAFYKGLIDEVSIFDRALDGLEINAIYNAASLGKCRASTATDSDGVHVPRIPNALRVYPNPFNPRATIAYVVREPGPVQLDVYNLLGRRVARLIDGHQPSGTYSVIWNGNDARGNRMGSGVYFLRLRTPRNAVTEKIVLAK